LMNPEKKLKAIKIRIARGVKQGKPTSSVRLGGDRVVVDTHRVPRGLFLGCLVSLQDPHQFIPESPGEEEAHPNHVGLPEPERHERDLPRSTKKT